MMVHRRQDPINKVSLLDASGHTELDMKSDELVLPSSSAETTETSDSENGNEVEVKSNNHTEKHTSAEAIEVTDAPDWPSNLIDVEKDVGKTLTSRLFHWGPMLAFGLIFTIGLTTTVVHFEFWSVTNPVAFINLSIFLYFNYGVMFNLIRASYVGGGYVTRGWHPSSNLSDARRLQYCAICESFKAPRSHHCKKCDRCVMKMDHHCPWINNCVGHRNHAYFVRFLFFAVVGCLHAVLILGFILYNTLSTIFIRNHGARRPNNPYLIRSLTTFVFVLLSVSFSVGVIIAVGVLLYTQISAVLRNKTGIEDYICAKAVCRGGEDEFVYPYDLGWKRNILEIFPSMWTSYPRGNGIWWPIRSRCTQFTLSEEQIVQKTNKRYAARIFDVLADSPGGICGGRKAGLRTVICQPCSDEARIEIKKGEAYAVTRINRYWIYGQRLLRLPADENSDDEIQGPFSDNPYADRANRDQAAIKQALEPRGWFPKHFARQRPRPKHD